MMFSRFLSEVDREGLVGDLAESGAGSFESVRETLFLLIRRQWLNWLYCASLSCLIAWQFRAAFSAERQEGVLGVIWLAFACLSRAALNLPMAVLLMSRSARAIWLNASLAVAVELLCSVYLNVTAGQAPMQFAIRIALDIALGATPLIAMVALRRRLMPYIVAPSAAAVNGNPDETC